MGSGSSSAKKGSAPACPVFYNFSPNAQYIPPSTLPTRDACGNMRRPQGGCAARIIALRHLPVVTADAKREAKELLANVSKMRKAKQGDEVALAKLAEAEEHAKSIQHDPSLTPAISSCFLLNIAVDEQGRLAPLSTDGAAGLTDAVNLGDNNGDSDSASESGSTAPVSQAHPPARKGFNFEATANNSQIPTPGNSSGCRSGADGAIPTPPLTVRRKSPQLTIVSPPNPEALSPNNTNNNANRNITGTPPSLRAGRLPQPPSTDAPAVPRPSQQGMGGPGPTPLPPLVGPKTVPTIFVPPPATVSDNDELDSNGFMSASTRSLLIKDSRFRRSEGAETNTVQVAAVAAHGDPTTTRLRRQNSRIKLVQVPNRTRWFLFNDSSTHEAQVKVMFCYLKQEGSGGVSTKVDCKESGASGSPSKMTTGYPAVPGEMKLMCVPTPVSHSAMAPKDVKKQLVNISSSSRSFVEVNPLTVGEFVAALPTPSAEPQLGQLAKFEANTLRMAAVCIFVVLAPGATVFLSEGEATGYMVETHMVPFNSSTSMAVVGRLLTPELVVSTKQKNAALVKDCYRHKLIYLAYQRDVLPVGATTVEGGGVPVTPPPSMLVPHPGGNLPTPPEQRGSLDGANNARKRMSSNTPGNNGNSNVNPVPINMNTALPPIKAPKPFSFPAVVATNPASTSGEPTGAPSTAAAAAPVVQPSHPQQRLSHRSPSATPTNTAGEVVANAEEQNDTQLRRKRIGSMLRNPDLVASMSEKDDERERSFHRELPSTNSLAISF